MFGAGAARYIESGAAAAAAASSPPAPSGPPRRVPERAAAAACRRAARRRHACGPAGGGALPRPPPGPAGAADSGTCGARVRLPRRWPDGVPGAAEAARRGAARRESGRRCRLSCGEGGGPRGEARLPEDGSAISAHRLFSGLLLLLFFYLIYICVWIFVLLVSSFFLHRCRAQCRRAMRGCPSRPPPLRAAAAALLPAPRSRFASVPFLGSLAEAF